MSALPPLSMLVGGVFQGDVRFCGNAVWARPSSESGGDDVLDIVIYRKLMFVNDIRVLYFVKSALLAVWDDSTKYATKNTHVALL